MKSLLVYNGLNMKRLPDMSASRWTVFGLVVFLLALWLAWPFVGIITGAILGAWVFYPLYQRLNTRLHRPSLAATGTFILALLIIAIPAAIVIGLSAIQLIHLASDLAGSYSAQGSDFSQVVRSLVGGFNDLARPLVGQDSISAQSVIEFVRTNVPTVLRGAALFLIGAAGNVPLAIILSIMYITLFLEFLVHGTQLVRLLQKTSPLGSQTTKLYLTRIGLMANAMVKGQLVIAFVIAVIAALLLCLLGFGKYFFLMVILFTILNLVPLGCGIVVMPVTLIAIIAGNAVMGSLVLILYILASNLDIVMRPRLIPKEITLSPGLTMVAAFAGISYFGLLGVVYGPIIMIVIVTSVQLFVKRADKKPA